VYAGVGAMLLIALAGLSTSYLTHRFTAVAPDALTSLPFQSGWRPLEHALSRYHVRWYPASLVFLAFDVEMLFMYPWAVVVVRDGVGAIVEMFMFLGALLLAVAWAWREGALRWV